MSNSIRANLQNISSLKKYNSSWFAYLLCAILILSGVGCSNNNKQKNDSKRKEKNTSMITLEGRIQVKKNDWQSLNWRTEETAIIICDMWGKHWCDNATLRVAEMAPTINEMIKKARELGITIVHAPSNTMEYYENHPCRKKALSQTYVEPPIELSYWFALDKEIEPELPIDDSDDGCDSPGNTSHKVWSRQIESIEIYNEDLLSDSGQEMHNYFKKNSIKNVLLCGVHTNMCILGRTFGIRGQVKVGRNVALIRDLTDAMYNPNMPLHVAHKEGTNLVINHIEKYWAPSVEWKGILN